ncbi:MAG TPA: hypothetical protein VFP84_14840 [Kofleriaceae bacterium]|nr:hypothetical protein [Kofleriaceae bacterium]
MLESYTGARPSEAKDFVGPVIEELTQHGYSAGNDVGPRFEGRVSRPAVVSTEIFKKLKAEADRGRDEWAHGRFDSAISILTPLINAARTNQGQFAQQDDEGLREAYQEALIALALSRKGQGDPAGMNEAFGELVRSFPTASLGAAYGPEANQAFEAVRKQLTARPGKLIVRVSDEGLAVYVNEQLEYVGSRTKANVATGEYRVLAKSGRQMSRSHRVEVRPGEESAVTIDLAFDEALHVARDWTGLSFATDADRVANESQYAARFATELGARSVAVVGIDVVQGHKVVIGSLINLATGWELRRATLAIDAPPPRDRLRALAKFLAGEAPASGIEVMVDSNGKGPPQGRHVDLVAARDGAPVAAPSRDVPRDEHPRWSGWKWISGGAAVAAIGAGTALVVLNGQCSATKSPVNGQCPRQYQTLGAGLGVLAGGAVLAGITTYLWLTEPRAKPATKAAFVAPTSGGALAGFAATF